ncbi:hypothetical protein HMPREF0682_2632 [Propionibacterium acidifaciens F0233]|uniref:Uncharacterized protein n=1 Tax=Propionibacterium acidifaciens F0233 TaxID=553198 RepID=U2QA83_9ACTN|nr:hypothetical protein HMPREF0682_2632 [Propionibacterium acidifaciens F0233]
MRVSFIAALSTQRYVHGITGIVRGGVSPCRIFVLTCCEKVSQFSSVVWVV